ncbi:MAG: hypothetical protein K9J81_12755 [Desulfohalobiaceae bacterium]|nr:hypothetical protein [Desulfohalobiaceae bacterium]
MHLEHNPGPLTVRAKLLYQPIAFRWAKNLKQQQAAAIDRFVSCYDSMSDQSWIVLCSDAATVRNTSASLR